MYLSALCPELPFKEAAQIYLSLLECSAAPPPRYAAEYIRKNTLRSYRQYIESLNLFFEAMPLFKITEGQMRAYQDARVAGTEPFIRYRRPHDAKERIVNGIVIPAKGKTSCPANPAKIKQELNFLIRILKRGGAWTKEHEDFRHFLVPKSDLPRALTPKQQLVWLECARSRERWERVYWWSLVAFDTLASPNELRLLRVGDVNLHHRLIFIRWSSAKTGPREREIGIRTTDALWALEQFLIRADELGSKSPTDALFPFRDKKTNLYNPKRSMGETGLYTLWNEVREASGLDWFRMEDTRHTGATRMAEAGINPRIIAERMGHSNEKMQRHYQHLSYEAQQAWLENPKEQFFRSMGTGWQPPSQMPPSLRSPQAGPGRWTTLRGRQVWIAG